MNIILMQLVKFVLNSLPPKKFIGQHLSSEDFVKWKNYITKEIDSLHVHLTVTSLNDHEIEKLITQVVDLSNTVNSYIFRQYRLIRTHPQSKIINAHYNITLDLLDGLILTFNSKFPIPAGKVKISDSYLYSHYNSLKKKIDKLAVYLRFSMIEEELRKIVLMGLLKLLYIKNITRNDCNYISEIIFTLLSKENLADDHLAELLIIHDFNTDDFYDYCTNIWKISLEDISGLHEQREMLLLEKGKIFDLKNRSRLSMPNNKKRLFFELNNFLDEKSIVVKRMVKLRRRVIKDNQELKNGKRFLINLSVPQFGLFLRMQIEKGILVKENLGDLFKFFATHFYTPNAEFISADSLQKKSTDVEFATAQKLKGQLIGMLNWLNTNYNLSNYN